MVRNYEVAFLLREGDAIKGAIERIKEYFGGIEASIEKDSDMGTRELAYEIIKNREKFKKAFYYFANVKAETTSLPDFETKLKYDTDVIRYMIVRED